MDKKNRTGLQSKISHIFAGVPVPKKKTPPSDNSESGKKDGIPDIMKDTTDDFVIEQTVNDPKAANPNLEDELSQEQFKIILEPDLSEKTEHSESEVVISESSTLDNLLAQDKSKPVSLDKKPLAQKPSKEEIEEKKPRVQEVTPEPPVKGTIEEKSKITRSKNSGVKDIIRTPKALVSNVPGLKGETEQITRIPGRTSLKTKGKNLKSKTAAPQPKQKLMVALIILLPILLVFVLLKNYGFFESSSSNTVIKQPPVSPVISAKVSGGLKINWQPPPVYPDGVRDPMGLIESNIDETVITNHPDLDVKGTSYVEGGDYKVMVGNESFKTDTIIKDNTGRDVKIIDIKKSQITFEMASVYWIYDLDFKKWFQNNNMDILGTN